MRKNRKYNLTEVAESLEVSLSEIVDILSLEGQDSINQVELDILIDKLAFNRANGIKKFIISEQGLLDCLNGVFKALSPRIEEKISEYFEKNNAVLTKSKSKCKSIFFNNYKIIKKYLYKKLRKRKLKNSFKAFDIRHLITSIISPKLYHNFRNDDDNNREGMLSFSVIPN